MSTLIIRIILTVVMMIIFAPSPQNSKNVAGSLEDFNFPTADETRPLQIVYGTVKAEGPNVLWYGDYRAEKITRKVSKPFGGSETQDTGQFRYYVGMQFGLGFGECDLLQIYTDETLIWEQDGSITGSFTDEIDEPTIYAQGDINEGIVGDFDWVSGTPTQLKNDYLNTQITTDVPEVDEIPAWKNLCYLVWKGGYIGNRSSLRPWKFVMRRIFTPDALAVQGEDYSTIVDENDPRFLSMNPMYIIFDIMTNKQYGGRFKEDDIDIDSFKSIAETLYNEGLGLSLIKDSVTTVRELLEEITKYCDVTIRLNRTTNKFEAKLIRDDYNIEDLPKFGIEADGTKNRRIERVVTHAIGGVDKKVNEVKIRYTVPSEKFINRIAHFTNEGARFEKDAIDSTTRDYLFLTSSIKAAEFAERDAIPLTTDLSTIEIYVNFFDVFDMNKGDAFVFNWQPYDIYNKVFRVQEIEFGEVGSKTAKLKAVQDSFGVKNASYVVPPPSGWKPIDTTPQPVSLEIFNAPLFFGNQKIIAYGEQPSGSSIGYKFIVNNNFDSNATGFSRVGTVLNDYSATEETEIEVSGVLDNLFNVGEEFIRGGNNICLITNTDGSKEFIAFELVEKVVGGYKLSNLWRGILDTRQKPITNGATIDFFSYGFASNNTYSVTQGSNDFKAETFTAKENLQNPPIISFNVDNRYLKPIVPAALEINGVVMGETIPSNTDLQLDWNIRNKLDQVVISKSTEEQTTTIEAGTSYELVIRDEFDNVLKTENLTTNSYTFDDETIINPSGTYYNILKVSLKSSNGGLDSHDNYDLTLTRP